jgi:putative NADH-flavin reductase
MKLTVLGANARTGRLLVQQALDAGHHVTAFMREPNKYDIQHPNLTLVQGNSMDKAAVAKAIQGADVVLNTVGPVKNAPDGLMETTAANILAGMQAAGVKRLVYLTGAGVKDEKDPPSFGAMVMVPLMKLMAGKTLNDSEAGARAVQRSDLDWTVVRAPRLGDDPPRGKYSAGYIAAGFTPMSRADVAAFMLEQASSDKFLRESPIIYYGD